MRKLILVVLLLSLARSAMAQDSATDVIGVERARARSCPQTDCTIITNLDPGTPIQILGTVDGETVRGSTQWYHISLNGLDAYVHSSLVTTTTTPITLASAPYPVTYNFGVCVSSRGQRTVQRVTDAALKEYARQGFDDPGTFTLYADCNLDALAETTCQLFCAIYGSDTNFWRVLWGGEVWGMSGRDASGKSVLLLRMAGPSGVITSTVRHELFHIFQQRLSGISVSGAPIGDVYALGPEWLTEGSAQVMACLCTRQLIAHMRRVPRSIALSAAAPTIGRFQISSNDFWALSEAGSGYLVRNLGGFAALRAYYSYLGQGMAWSDAFASAFGITIDEFYADFEAYRGR